MNGSLIQTKPDFIPWVFHHSKLSKGSWKFIEKKRPSDLQFITWSKQVESSQRIKNATGICLQVHDRNCMFYMFWPFEDAFTTRMLLGLTLSYITLWWLWGNCLDIWTAGVRNLDTSAVDPTFSLARGPWVWHCGIWCCVAQSCTIIAWGCTIKRHYLHDCFVTCFWFWWWSYCRPLWAVGEDFVC